MARARLPDASMAVGTVHQHRVEPEEQTRAWKPDRTLLQQAPQPASASGFELAADEQTVIGATNLTDARLFRSEPPPAPIQEAEAEPLEHEESLVEFVGSLNGFNPDEAQSAMDSAWGEKTTLYKPQRSHLPPEEPTDEFEAAVAPGEAEMVGAEPRKVIIAPAVLAGSVPDPARAEATKKRRARPGTDTKLGLWLCLLGGAALALSIAWRHPKTAPLTHDAFAKVAAAVSSLKR
jgi:hypothetical protein